MVDWNLPSTAQGHSAELASHKQRDESVAKMDYTGDTNLPDGAVRWNPTENRFEQLQSGSWGPLSSLYAITVTQANNAGTLGGQDSAWHRDRTNHTGQQPLSTISNAGTAAGRNVGVGAAGEIPDRAAADIRYAAIGGNNSQTFSVANASSASHAVNRSTGDSRYLNESSNLSDLPDKATARSNLSVYSTSQANSEIESRIDDRFPVSQSQVGNSSVGNSELKTTAGSNSVTREQNRSENLTIPGGQYSFSVRTQGRNRRRGTLEADSGVETTVGGSGAQSIDSTSFDTIYGLGHIGHCRFYLESTNATEMQAIFHSRYMQSSPPYDHGDGPVHGYAYAKIEEDKVIGLYLAEDPPWYGNTENPPVEQWRDPKTGKEYQKTRKLKCCKRDVDEGRISMAEFIKRAGECDDVVEEITPEIKLRGMDQLPHPFQEEAGCAVVLLDPMDEKIARLIRMMQLGESVHDLFSDGYLVVDNQPCKRCGPPGIPVHQVKWRKT